MDVRPANFVLVHVPAGFSLRCSLLSSSMTVEPRPRPVLSLALARGPRAANGGLPVNRFGSVAGRAVDGGHLVSFPDQPVAAVGLEHDWTDFHVACLTGTAECTEALTRAGCDVGLKELDGDTGRKIAEDKGHTALLERLRVLVAQRLGAAQAGLPAPTDLTDNP